MDILSLLSTHVIAPLSAFKDKEMHFSYLKQLRKSQYMNSDELMAYQAKNLNTLMIHAYDNVPFYRKRLNNANINPHKGNVKDYFHKIPFLTKEDIQTHLSELTASNYNPGELIANKTGGSTGKPLHYYHNIERVYSMKAVELRHNEWAGWRIGDKKGVLWGARRDINAEDTLKTKLRKRLIDRFLVLDTSSITDLKMLNFANELIKFKPKGILAYANSIYEFAKFVKENNISGIAPYSIITSAEVLHEHERELVEEVFGCKVFNRYGCREVAVIASECEKHNGLHIAADSLFVEFIKDDGTAAGPQEEGNIIVTDMFNWGMPFIRYMIEDRGVPANRVCPCGRTLPLMERVTGRVTDFLVTPDGVKVSGASVTIYLIANTPGIKQAQFVQDKTDEIILKLVKADDYSDDTLKFLSSRMPEFFGKHVTVMYEFVEDIPKTPSGKYRFSICNL
jgi:phenylacetate-coenzyme A ligase PaaK-like adenylate-forming protein